MTTMGRSLSRLLSFAVVLLLSLCAWRDARSAPADPAARGLDVFVHAPAKGSVGHALPVQLLVFGFPTVSQPRPLAGARVELAWDPEKLGVGVTQAPAPVVVETDSNGRAHAEVELPPGPPAQLSLLVGLRHGEHERTRELPVERVDPLSVLLQVPERSVVPGSTIPAWLLVVDSATGAPLPGTAVELALLEGSVARFSRKLVTDRSGSAIGRVPVPPNDQPDVRWILRARAYGPAGTWRSGAALELSAREETPATPELRIEWAKPWVRAGGTVGFVVRLRDAAGEPVANHELRYWAGPRGTVSPTDRLQWVKASSSGRTDAAGELRGELTVASTVPLGGTTHRLEVRARFEGQDLERGSAVSVRRPIPTIELLPEAGSLVPGLEQRLLLRARDEQDQPLRGTFTVRGDGLDARVSTDPQGEAELSWKVPAEVGAFRGVGPCASRVAANVSVRPTEPLASLAGRTEPFDVCLDVDRESGGIVRIEPLVAIAGAPVRVRVASPSRSAWSIALTDPNGTMAVSGWIADGAEGGELRLPPKASGRWAATAVAVGSSKASSKAVGAFLVRPAALPKLEARIVGGRLAPGGQVRVEATLSDGQGHPIVGAIAAMAQDRHGGGSLEALWSLDARRALCAKLSRDTERCDALLGRTTSLDPVRRGDLGATQVAALEPRLDPAASLEESVANSFGAVVRSLEGAVRDASGDPEALRDVRRRQGRGWEFNPELWTLVTAAMAEPPVTPGGELLSLADLAVVDPQISFDRVASRVTRLKLFKGLAALRQYARERYFDFDEPAFADPEAMLRRVVRQGMLQPSDLLDPWGGELRLVKRRGLPLPFLTVRGFALVSPGPDGRLETADDVSDPFQRVLRSGSPYAVAMREDELVDARLDMQVGDATVDAWQSIIEQVTGETLGAGGLGLSGIGEGGGGRGEGIGLGSIGTIGHGRGGRSSLGMPDGDVVWIPPARTDAQGKLSFDVPLADRETTWQIALVALPDDGPSAVAMVEAAVSLPLSTRVETGTSWTLGDEAAVRITVRNRTAKPAENVRLELTPEGAVVAGPSTKTMLSVAVPARGATEITATLRARSVGEARLRVRASAAGMSDDVVTHRWSVREAGELTDVSRMAWIDGEHLMTLPLPPELGREVGPVRLVLERGVEATLRSAMESLDPDRLTQVGALSDSLDVASRVHRWAAARGSAAARLAEEARGRAIRALARHSSFESATWGEHAGWWLGRQVRTIALGVGDAAAPAWPQCPASAGSLGEGVAWVALEPPPDGSARVACWDVHATETTRKVLAARDPVLLARLVLALDEIPGRTAVRASLARRLEELTPLGDDGRLVLPEQAAADRQARAIIAAARLREATRAGQKAVADRLLSAVLIERDATGGFGSSDATRAAVRALLALTPDDKSGPTRVTLGIGEEERVVRLAPSATQTVTLPAGVDQVTVVASDAPVLARLVRRKLRPWSVAPAVEQTPVSIDVQWPQAARAGTVQALDVTIQQSSRRAAQIEIRIPLPPGARLARPLSGVRQVRGALAVRETVDPSDVARVVQIPIRFGLTGRFTLPEAEGRLVDEQAARALTHAATLVVR